MKFLHEKNIFFDFFFLTISPHPEEHRLMPFGRVWAGPLGVIIRAGKSNVYGLDLNMYQLSARCESVGVKSLIVKKMVAVCDFDRIDLEAEKMK